MKSGFVSIIGKPNVGKSTFVNKLLRQKISIVSPKHQTTRTTVYGILNRKNSQIVFIDTPGVHKPENALGLTMNKIAIKSSKDAEVILFFVEVEDTLDKLNEKILNTFKDREAKVILILTKIDRSTHVGIIENMTYWKDKYDFDAIVPISTFKEKNIGELVIQIESFLPEGPMYYERDAKTNRSVKFQIAEIIREKTLYLLKQEVPHSIGVEIYKIDEAKKVPDIHANILVERDSQKGIVVGKQASMIKEIGQFARRDIEKIYRKKVNLQLHVKVQADWRKNEKFFNMVGVEIEG